MEGLVEGPNDDGSYTSRVCSHPGCFKQYTVKPSGGRSAKASIANKRIVEHEKIHSGQQYVCDDPLDHCGKSYPQKKNLTKHQKGKKHGPYRNDDTDRNHHCPNPGHKNFGHSGGTCDDNHGAGWVSRTGRDNHVRTSMLGVRLPCGGCKADFAGEFELARHLDKQRTYCAPYIIINVSAARISQIAYPHCAQTRN